MATLWIAVVVDEDEALTKPLAVGTRNACMDEVERNFWRFADRKARKVLEVPPPVWHRDSFNGVSIKGEWLLVEDHDSGIVYGKVVRVREARPNPVRVRSVP